MLEPAEFLAFPETCVAVDLAGAAVVHVHRHIEKMQADTGHQDRGDRYQGHQMTGSPKPRTDHRTLVLAEQFLDTSERDRIDVPGVARDVGHVLDDTIVRRVEAVIHARSKPERDIEPVTVGLDQRRVVQQIAQGIGKSLGLKRFDAVDGPTGTDDAIAGARQHLRVGVDLACARLQLTGEAGMKAVEGLLLRIPEIEIGEQPPDRDRCPRQPGMLDPAEPAKEARRQPAGNAVRQQKVDVLVLQHLREFRTDHLHLQGS